MQRLTILFSLAFLAISSAQENHPAFELRDGDRVLLLGNSFFERALDYGEMETALALRWPDRNITFRNLGWDGDTVFGHSRTGGRRRSVFGDAEEGFLRMIEHVKSLKPTVIFLAYGFNESFAGEGGLEAFREGATRLLNEISSKETRIVILTPTPMEVGFGPDESAVASRNAILAQYQSVLVDIAKSSGLHLVNLSGPLQALEQPYSENGIHPSEAGYRAISDLIGEQLKLPPMALDLSSPEAKEIRTAIIKKNVLYFHRWRPRNDAFVFGERKDEQKIAQTEPEQFEPFIAKQEQLIRDLIRKHTQSQ